MDRADRLKYAGDLLAALQHKAGWSIEKACDFLDSIPDAELNNQKQKPVTNADRIRAMSDEELAEVFGGNDICGYIQDNTKWCENRDSCANCIIDWLKQSCESVQDRATSCEGWC